MTQPIVSGYITSDYGYRVLNGKKEFHPGLDISSLQASAPVYCAIGGKIIAIGWSNPEDKKASFGLRVWVKVNESLYIVYGHLALIDSDLKKGMELHEGNQIGIMGSTGKSFGVHLHIEARSMANIQGSHNTKECIDFINRIKALYV